MAEPGTITIKVVLDTTEAEAQLAALRAAAMEDLTSQAFGWRFTPLSSSDEYRRISPYIVTMVGKLDGMWISPTDSEYLIQCIRSRTR